MTGIYMYDNGELAGGREEVFEPVKYEPDENGVMKPTKDGGYIKVGSVSHLESQIDSLRKANIELCEELAEWTEHKSAILQRINRALSGVDPLGDACVEQLRRASNIKRKPDEG